MSTLCRLPLLTLAFAFVACSSSNTDDLGTGPVDSGVPADSGVDPNDSGVNDTGLPPDSGVPLPCQRDQGGVANRGCDPGQVCNLSMDPPACVAGTACNTDNDCNDCSALVNPDQCGHGYHLTAWCDTNHKAPGSQMAGTCTRSRSPCEPCEVDADCGRQDSILGGAANKCLAYDDGSKACGRPCTLGCPDGFACDATSQQCKRASGGTCGGEPVICPRGATPTTQIARGDVCPDTGGARCSTNDQPGALGVCIGFCVDNTDCPANLPVCNQANGICINGCTAGSCPQGEVCHSDGFCNPPCVDDQACESDPKYGPNTYCNIQGRPEPRLYKSYRDTSSCAPLGCERKVDCPAAGLVCDNTQAPPACVQGCYERDDCLSGLLCKSGPQGSYNREQCRGLPEKTDMSEIGVCCDPGCLDRTLQCAIGEYCCAEEDSPYEDPSSCLPKADGNIAQAGECFPMASPMPWCAACDGTPGQCNSGWTFGYNVDPNINGGQPFQEQEFCTLISGDPEIAICTVTCNPEAPDSGCPGRWSCAPNRYSCLQDADCGGLECINEDTTTNPPRRGQCKCGENGVAQIACPDTIPNAELVAHPRCIEVGTNMVCISSYTCQPSFQLMSYPAGCGFP